MAVSDVSIQETYIPHSICFGCGPSNVGGLQLKSYSADDGSVVATFVPDAVHQAFEDILCGGIVSTVLDCHAAAAAGLVLGAFANEEPVVTKEFTVRLRGATPIAPVHLRASATEVDHRSAVIVASLTHDGRVTAEFEGTFVCPGRPR
jgi:acyl-coenzyme A thioesterase PaaI-like protein